MTQPKQARAVVTYSGNVQGVGFRMTAVRLVQGASITGWVQNQPNGDVVLDAEGEQSALNAYLKRIEQEMGHHISAAQVDWRTATQRYQSFEIRY